jgi:hypothetical protein
MGKVFTFSEKWDKEDLPILTYRKGRISISRIQYEDEPSSKTDLPTFSLDENGKSTEKNILDTSYCGRCLRNFYDPRKPRDHFVCTIGNFWKCLPDIEQDSFGKGCKYIAPINLPSYLRRTVSETVARWNERPGKSFSFSKERARKFNIDLRRTRWGEKVVKEGMLSYIRKHDLKKM